MLALLDLPRELRDKILSFVLETPAAPPSDTIDNANRKELHDVKYNGWNGGLGVKYVLPENRTEAFPTLLVNRQLRSETLAALDILPTKHSYDLDIMIVDESELWPTWLCVPALSTRVDKVHATFRTFGTGKKKHSDFQIGCGSPPNIVWCLYSLLERFLRVGPKGTQAKEHDEFVSIKLLELDVRTPNVPPEMIAPKDVVRIDLLEDLRKKTGIDYVMHSDYIANFIRSEINSLLYMGYHTAQFGGILFERVGTVRLVLDGEVLDEWDLAKLLGTVCFHDSFENFPRERRPDIFKKWKASAYKTRVQLGLPVVPFEEEEN